MPYLPRRQFLLALSPAREDRMVSASTLVAGATLAVSVGLLVWAFVKTR
ncbi:MAG: hypothetical protein QOI63_132 [Thermoplasmata archaeon]|jgi:hypothetical protein|nr:hypothetical protein [Thermoplasmata archaeon]